MILLVPLLFLIRLHSGSFEIMVSRGARCKNKILTLLTFPSTLIPMPILSSLPSFSWSPAIPVINHAWGESTHVWGGGVEGGRGGMVGAEGVLVQHDC